jgi:hypothetical protein
MLQFVSDRRYKSALLGAARGQGHRRLALAAQLNVPAGTVRGWLRRAAPTPRRCASSPSASSPPWSQPDPNNLPATHAGPTALLDAVGRTTAPH